MEKPYVVGIDIGGTNTVFGVVDARGTVLYSGSIKTGKYSEIEEYVSALAQGLKQVIDQAGGPEKIKGIGVGAPNGNFFNGCIEFAPNLPWKGKIPLAQMISEAVDGIPVALTNDANAAAIGEMTYGAARGMKDFIVITLGTGVGSGIVIGGNLVYGHDGFAGELGHVIVRRNNGRLCGCGRQGCLEAYTSATGVARTAREYLEIRKDESVLRDLDPAEITSKDVYDAAMKNNHLVRWLDQGGRLVDEPDQTRVGQEHLEDLRRQDKTAVLPIERERRGRFRSERIGLGGQRAKSRFRPLILLGEIKRQEPHLLKDAAHLVFIRFTLTFQQRLI